jgi:hypothetical protein
MGAGFGLQNPAGLLSVATSEVAFIVASTKPPVGVAAINSTGPWTPPQYSKPALTILTVPATVSSNPTGSSGAPVFRGTPSVNYVFDAVIRISHNRRLKKTQHPVLTGANISDHAYIEAARVTLEIGMSDAMASFSAGVWVGSSTKSISAWQIIKGLQVNKTLLTLTTRLDTYSNMLIVEANSPDENKTLTGLRATIVLEEIIAGSVASQPNSSARPQTTGSTANGTVQGTAINPAQVQQNVIPSALFANTQTFPSVPGASNVSSNSLGTLPTQ